MAHEQIGHQDIGDTFSGTYYVQAAYIKKTTTNRDYTDMTLRDKSGARPVKYWGTVKDLEKGCFVFVAAVVEDYQGSASIIARNVELVDEPKDLSDYIPSFEDAAGLAEGFDDIRAVIAGIEKDTKDDTCGLLVDEVYHNGKFFDRFVRSPGSDGPHYGKIGGLLANVVCVADHASKAAAVYALQPDESNVLITAALLCRVGGADAYDMEDCMPVMSKRGVLLGVSNLTMSRITSAIRRVIQAAKTDGKSVSQDVILRVLHAVVASGKIDGVTPMTKEALILAGILELDTEVVDAIDFIENDANKDEEFTSFDARLGRRYYRG